MKQQPPPATLTLPTVDDLDRVSTGALLALIAELAALQAYAAARLRTTDQGPPSPAAGDRALTAQEAARRLGLSTDWIYRNKDRLPFTIAAGRRSVRFSERGLERWLTRRR
jgi:excisionase family DNA binding protein